MLERFLVRMTPLVLMLLLAPGAFAQTTVMIGEMAILEAADDGNRNLLVAQETTLTEAATLQSLSFYVTKAVGQLRLGVYDASGPGGGPGVKKAETSAFKPSTGWNTRAVLTPVLLPAGTYWLAYFPSHDKLAFRKRLTGSARYYRQSFGTMPMTFSTTPTAETVHWSLYATLSPSAASPAPAAPAISLTATPSAVDVGQSTTLAWSSTDATSCAASGAWSGAQPLSGQSTQSPPSTATYTLTCTGAGGSTAKSVTVTVASAPAPTLTLTASPTSVPSGGSSTLTWSSTNATSCTASNVGAEGSTWSGPKPTSGSDVRGPLTATATYSLACTGSGGTVSRSVTITVSEALPTPTLSLTADPTSVAPGQPFTLTWSSSNATSCTASGGWSGSQPLSGQLTVSTNSTATYTLTCTGTGGSIAASVTVTVTASATYLTLNWVDNAGGTAVFKIERREGSKGTYLEIATTGTGAVEYMDTTPVTGTTYCYRVRASNGSGDSDYSNEACRTP